MSLLEDDPAPRRPSQRAEPAASTPGATLALDDPTGRRPAPRGEPAGSPPRASLALDDPTGRRPAPRGKPAGSPPRASLALIERLAVRRGGRTVIDGVSLEAGAGEIVGVVGKNGCGKSTLLACVAGVLPPRDGRVLVDGASVWGPRRERTRARRALGYVPEAADPPGFLLGGELWALCAASRGAGPPSAELRAALGLDELRTTALERMSLGQRRRACLGAAFIGPPKLLVLDEPDNGLDIKRLDALVALVRAHAADGGACLLASHDAALLDQLGARIHAMPDRPAG